MEKLITTAPERTIFGKRTRRYKAYGFGLEASAKTAVEAADVLQRDIQNLIDAYSHTRYIFCMDGTVLAVRYSYQTWGYDIIGPGRNPSHVVGMQSFNLAKVAAREHALQSYGGIRSEC